MSEIPARLGIQQRVLPVYRAPLFETLAAACPLGLGVLAGQPQAEEGIVPAGELNSARLTKARNVHIGKVPNCIFWQNGMRAWLESFRPNVLVMEANLRNMGLPAAARWMHSRGRGVIGWGLGAPGSTGHLRPVWRAFIRQFDALIAYSARGAQEYAALGYPPERIFIAHNAATHRPVQPPPSRPAKFADDRATLLFVGRLQARKRLDLLFSACAALPASQQPRLWIVGDGPERAALESLATQVYPTAEFFGAKHGAELDPFYAGADLFVLPGTGGLAVQQAMSAGLPVLVARGDGTQDDLVRPGNGWQIAPDQLDALTAALNDAISDPDLLRVMGAESYRIVAEEVNLEAMADVFANAVASIYPTCCNFSLLPPS